MLKYGEIFAFRLKKGRLPFALIDWTSVGKMAHIMADTVLKNMRNIKHYDGNKWVRIKRQKIWLDGKIVRRTKTFSFWRLVCGKIPAKSIPPPPRRLTKMKKTIDMTWIPTLTIWINFLPLFQGGSTWNLASVGPLISHTHTHTHIHTHNLGSSEKLSPGE